MYSHDNDKNKPESTIDPASPLQLESFLPYRINVLSNLVLRALSRIYGEHFEIGIPEWRVLATLGEFGTTTAKQVGMHSHMHKTKVSRAVATLEKRNLLTRRANRADLRESFLSLTPAGETMYRRLVPLALDFAVRLTANLDPQDMAAFERVLTVLVDRSKVLAADTEIMVD